MIIQKAMSCNHHRATEALLQDAIGRSQLRHVGHLRSRNAGTAAVESRAEITGKPWENYGKSWEIMGHVWKMCGKCVGDHGKFAGKHVKIVGKFWENMGDLSENMGKLRKNNGNCVGKLWAIVDDVDGMGGIYYLT